MERLAAILGPIPIAEELLEAFEVDNPQEILEKVQGYQEFVAFMEEQQAAQEAQEKEQAGSVPA